LLKKKEGLNKERSKIFILKELYIKLAKQIGQTCLLYLLKFTISYSNLPLIELDFI
jgi:hypothetical protein